MSWQACRRHSRPLLGFLLLGSSVIGDDSCINGVAGGGGAPPGAIACQYRNGECPVDPYEPGPYDCFRGIFRRWSWRKNTNHHDLLHRPSPPYWMPGYGYHETQWRRGESPFDAYACPPVEIPVITEPMTQPVDEPTPPPIDLPESVPSPRPKSNPQYSPPAEKPVLPKPGEPEAVPRLREPDRTTTGYIAPPAQFPGVTPAGSTQVQKDPYAHIPGVSTAPAAEKPTIRQAEPAAANQPKTPPQSTPEQRVQLAPATRRLTPEAILPPALTGALTDEVQFKDLKALVADSSAAETRPVSVPMLAKVERIAPPVQQVTQSESRPTEAAEVHQGCARVEQAVHALPPAAPSQNTFVEPKLIGAESSGESVPAAVTQTSAIEVTARKVTETEKQEPTVEVPVAEAIDRLPAPAAAAKPDLVAVPKVEPESNPEMVEQRPEAFLPPALTTALTDDDFSLPQIVAANANDGANPAKASDETGWKETRATDEASPDRDPSPLPGPVFDYQVPPTDQALTETAHKDAQVQEAFLPPALISALTGDEFLLPIIIEADRSRSSVHKDERKRDVQANDGPEWRAVSDAVDAPPRPKDVQLSPPMKTRPAKRASTAEDAEWQPIVDKTQPAKPQPQARGETETKSAPVSGVPEIVFKEESPAPGWVSSPTAK